MKLDLSSILRKSDSLLESDLGEEKVMMSIERGEYFGLNHSGRYLFDLCDGQKTVGEILECVSGQYDTAATDWRDQSHAFLSRLLRDGMVEIAD
ncbi:MAG: PqqD family protein [Vulcanimicrobiota bacterium]